MTARPLNMLLILLAAVAFVIGFFYMLLMVITLFGIFIIDLQTGRVLGYLHTRGHLLVYISVYYSRSVSTRPC